MAENIAVDNRTDQPLEIGGIDYPKVYSYDIQELKHTLRKNNVRILKVLLLIGFILGLIILIPCPTEYYTFRCGSHSQVEILTTYLVMSLSIFGQFLLFPGIPLFLFQWWSTHGLKIAQLILEEDGFSYQRADKTPKISLTRDKISNITEINQAIIISILVRPFHLKITPDLENFEELKEVLNSWVPILPREKLLKPKVVFYILLVILFGFFIIQSIANPWISTGVIIFIITSFGFAIWKILSAKHLDLVSRIFLSTIFIIFPFLILSKLFSLLSGYR